ncbi:MAG TPA: hypothetical protein VIP11_09070 [Gemmatimonadaceae bacterium]
MPQFILELEFAGLALFVRRTGNAGIRVLFPDARGVPGVTRRHRDKKASETAVPHAAYIRFNMHDLPAFAADSNRVVTDDTPSYEIVHRLQDETISFSVPGVGPLETGSAVTQTGLDIPDFSKFASELKVRPQLATGVSNDGIVGRLDLSGGEIESFNVSPELWRLANVHNGKHAAVPDSEYGGTIVWSSPQLNGDRVVVTLTPFAGGKPTQIELVANQTPGPTPRIRIKIANLCANNPLEWDELPPRLVAQDDLDFKWLYQMLEHRTKAASAWETELPVPVPIAALVEGELYDCFPGKIDES